MLKNEIDKAKRSVKTESLQISIGEIASMYNNEELNILPDFQRLFRWSREKKSSFIESILIGIPIPPAFAYENEDGTWELIDGLQRLSTVFEFMGILRSADDNIKLPHAELVETKYLPSLQGVVWSDGERVNEGAKVLDKSFQLFIRRARIDFQVLKHPSDRNTKFDLFQRLNRGGAYANEQEVRSCAMVLANNSFTQYLKSLVREESFSKIFNISDDNIKNQRDVEYIVRLASHTYYDIDQGGDVQEFLDSAIINVMTEQDEDDVIEALSWTVNTLYSLFGDRALLPQDPVPEGVAKNRFALMGAGGNRGRYMQEPESNTKSG